MRPFIPGPILLAFAKRAISGFLKADRLVYKNVLDNMNAFGFHSFLLTLLLILIYVLMTGRNKKGYFWNIIAAIFNKNTFAISKIEYFKAHLLFLCIFCYCTFSKPYKN